MPRFRAIFFPAALLLSANFVAAADTPDVKTIQEFLKDKHTVSMDGFLPMVWDAQAGKLYLQIRKLDQDFLFVTSLPYGLGLVDLASPDLQLDRGNMQSGNVVHFSRFGPRVLLVQPNLDYRSSSKSPAERIAVKQSFAESVVAGFDIQAEENGAVLIDATEFFCSDAFGVTKQLAESKQGDYKVELKRSGIVWENAKDFPLNTEIESLLTFVTDKLPDKSRIDSVAPDAKSVTLREHYSFIQLPDIGYQPRAFDPRAGYFALTYRDNSAPLGSPMDQRLIVRHNLQKKDPNSAVSEPVSPIVYYVDRGAPEPIRSALLEGANWWGQAFE